MLKNIYYGFKLPPNTNFFEFQPDSIFKPRVIWIWNKGHILIQSLMIKKQEQIIDHIYDSRIFEPGVTDTPLIFNGNRHNIHNFSNPFNIQYITLTPADKFKIKWIGGIIKKIVIIGNTPNMNTNKYPDNDDDIPLMI